jgi:hypothetical protein
MRKALDAKLQNGTLPFDRWVDYNGMLEIC